MRSPWIMAILAAGLYVLVLNGAFLRAQVQGLDSPAYLRIERGSSDQAQYVAYMRTVAQGHTLMGNVALREHKDDRGNVIYGPIFQGLLARFTGLSIESVIVLGNFVFPFLAFLTLFAILKRFLDPLSTLSVTCIAMNVIGIGWLRLVSPQITLLTFLLYLLIVLRGDPALPRTRMLRGFLVGSLLFIQAQYALLAAIIEGTDLLWQLFMRRENMRQLFRELTWSAVPFLILVGVRAYLSLTGDPLLVADASRRFGLMPSHLPTSPMLQLKVLGVVVFFLWVWFAKKTIDRDRERFFVLLLAAFIALNQSIIHGFDAVFRLYYPYPVTVILWVCFAIALARLLQGRRLQIALGLLCIISLASFTKVALGSFHGMKAEAEAYDAMHAPEILESISVSGGSVIAAPFAIADLIPAFTDSTVLINHYARFGLVSDRELAERFMLYRRLFPEPHPTVDDPSKGIIFAHYPGNLAARKRTLCKILSVLHPRDCTIDQTTEIVNQDVFRMITEDQVDEEASMRRFGVHVLIRSRDGQGSIPDGCMRERAVGSWDMYLC